jgi:hypothetical protein
MGSADVYPLALTSYSVCAVGVRAASGLLLAPGHPGAVRAVQRHQQRLLHQPRRRRPGARRDAAQELQADRRQPKAGARAASAVSSGPHMAEGAVPGWLAGWLAILPAYWAVVSVRAARGCVVTYAASLHPTARSLTGGGELREVVQPLGGQVPVVQHHLWHRAEPELSSVPPQRAMGYNKLS